MYYLYTDQLASPAKLLAVTSVIRISIYPAAPALLSKGISGS